MDKLREEKNGHFCSPWTPVTSSAPCVSESHALMVCREVLPPVWHATATTQFYLRLLDSFLKEDSDWGQFFTISAIQELVTQATPQKPNFCISSFVHPLEPFIHLFNKRLFLHNIILPLKYFEDTDGVCLAVHDHSTKVCLLSAWIFSAGHQVWLHSCGLRKNLMYQCLCCSQAVKGVSTAAFLLMCPWWAAAAKVVLVMCWVFLDDIFAVQ